MDCSHVGLNYVLNGFKMIGDAKSENIGYSYGCGANNQEFLTCSQFYTSLVDPKEKSDMVSSLADHSVSCFTGAALQQFQYEKDGDSVRYSYVCCVKSSIPTPSPTPVPSESPTPYPTLVPIANPTMFPLADPTNCKHIIDIYSIHIICILFF